MTRAREALAVLAAQLCSMNPAALHLSSAPAPEMIPFQDSLALGEGLMLTGVHGTANTDCSAPGSRRRVYSGWEWLPSRTLQAVFPPQPHEPQIQQLVGSSQQGNICLRAVKRINTRRDLRHHVLHSPKLAHGKLRPRDDQQFAQGHAG